LYLGYSVFPSYVSFGASVDFASLVSGVADVMACDRLMEVTNEQLIGIHFLVLNKLPHFAGGSTVTLAADLPEFKGHGSILPPTGE
jgi:hypothetical protein